MILNVRVLTVSMVTKLHFKCPFTSLLLCFEEKLRWEMLSFWCHFKTSQEVARVGCRCVLFLNGIRISLSALIVKRRISLQCVHMTSRRPCWRSKQRNGGHVGGVKYSFGDWTLFLCKFLLLFHYANMASGHMSAHFIEYILSLIHIWRCRRS